MKIALNTILLFAFLLSPQLIVEAKQLYEMPAEVGWQRYIKHHRFHAEIRPDDLHHSDFNKKSHKTKLEEWAAKHKEWQMLTWKQYFQDKQACMLCVEIFELAGWENSYNKPEYQKYYLEYKNYSLNQIKAILKNSIDEAKLATSAGSILDKHTFVSRYSPQDKLVNSLLKEALEIDKDWRNKQIDDRTFKVKKRKIF